jgi:hypothetical protein
MVSDRPKAIHTELVDPARPRGWGSHRLHNASGPAVEWDGFAVYAWHGTRVPADVIETPAAEITAERITGEPNVEIRRALIERVGTERFLALVGAEKVAVDDWGTLWRADRPDDGPYLAVEVLNSTPEPDGTTRTYFLRVPGTVEQPERRCVSCETDIARVPTTPLEAIAWSYRSCAAHYGAVAVQT